MSNAKIAEMIAQAQLQTAQIIAHTLAPLSKDLAELRADFERLQSLITPMVADLERLRSMLPPASNGIQSQRERGTPPE